MFGRFFKKSNKIDRSYLGVIEDFCQSFNTTIAQAEARLSERVGEDCLYFINKDTIGEQLESLYFSIISIVMEDVEKILEIGTGMGTKTNILSKLFPKAHIYTLDLPKSDNDFDKLALRKEKEELFHVNIARENITFLETNSFFMPSLNIPQRFDLAWVDGGHCYPTVAWDIMYAYNATKKGGFLLMDDYNRPNSDVKQVVDRVNEVIEEEIYFLPFAGSDKNGKICWLRRK